MSETISKRYLFTIIASLVRAFISFSTGMLVARFLGPKDYGNMSFLLGTFLAIRQLLDMGSAQAFFTFMSQKLRSKFFVRSYFAWLTLQFVIVTAAIALIFPEQWIQTIWHGEERPLIIGAFAAAFLQNSIWPSVQQSLEAQRLTYKTQSIGISIVLVHCIAVFILWYSETIGLYSIFIAIFIEYLIAVFIAYRFLEFTPPENEEQGKTRGEIYRMFISYCTPIIIYSWVGFVYSFADTWLLQHFAGSIKQAYYAVSAQFAAVALLATSSISNIFYKEIAEAYHKQDMDQVKRIYFKVSRSLFLTGAIISCFLIPWTKDLLQNILGASYTNGYVTLSIMFLYPIHQSMGQIGGSVLFATEQVSLQAKIGIAFMLLSIIVTYLVLAPANGMIPGLHLGSEGLAIKMLVMQFLQVNIIAYCIATIFKSSFDWIYQPISIFGCLALGWLAHFLVIYFGNSELSFLYRMILGGSIYIFFIAGFVFLVPSLTGLTRNELRFFVEGILQKFTKARGPGL
jgi:O-antigen/teichoic acid export membrane protein